MTKNTVFLIVLLGLMVSPGNAFAHGVTVKTSFEGRVVVVSSSYSPTQPLVDATVTIYSPADPEKTWQTGRTDKAGHFAFLPDVEGEWIIGVDDQKGHRVRTAVVFTPDMPEEGNITTAGGSADPADNKLDNIHKIIIGLSLIVGVTGTFYGLKANQVRIKQ